MAIVVTKPEVAFSNQRAQVNELLYSLGNDAKKNEFAEQLLLERDREIRAAYEFSYGVATLDPLDRWYTSDTFHVASEIIALKERYAKRIRRCEVRHERFKRILDDLPVNDSEILLRAFCTDIEVDEGEVKRVIRKHLKLIENHYEKSHLAAQLELNKTNEQIEGDAKLIEIVPNEEKRQKRLAKLRNNIYIKAGKYGV